MRYDTKVEYLIFEYVTNELNDKIPIEKSIGIFDSLLTPFSLQETQVYGATFTKNSVKVLCRDSRAYNARSLKIKNQEYKIIEKKDYKKVFLFICEKVVGKNVNSN
ncbi:hypothetical protein CON34_05975 [Bacillus thuringiensis]|uniref:hypothetical protein n=1 Tax=Bacillus thuringiensis TaxID=1428 RepID=UPI000BEE2B0F|nr:hypothetical protein [Bacillus thuringiensis]PED27307.1 hypothetical protein CON34_05975 [Bacillus thuringiensis]